MAFELCSKIIQISKTFFNAFNEEVIKKNFVFIYEMLDGTRRPPPQRSHVLFIYLFFFRTFFSQA